jgi:hypothetical protein
MILKLDTFKDSAPNPKRNLPIMGTIIYPEDIPIEVVIWPKNINIENNINMQR